MSKRWTQIATYFVLTLVAMCAITLVEHSIMRDGRAAADPPSEIVPVELVLLVDVSGSIDDGEYALQKNGYAAAFNDSEVINTIERLGGMAVVYIEWGRADGQSVRVDWTRLDTAADCQAFAQQIQALSHIQLGSTRMAPALEFAANQIDTNQYSGFKRIIDVSGDGRCQNYDYYTSGVESGSDGEYGTPWASVIPGVRSTAHEVNGVCITSDEDVIAFYRDVLPQGETAFMMQVNDFSEFSGVIREKILKEIAVIPGMFD